jgi:hypothetical protein
MDRPNANSAAFLSFTGLLIVATASGVAYGLPKLHELARRQSIQLSQAAIVAGPTEAETDFHLAAWLDHANEAASLGLARTQIASGQPEAALHTLSRAGQGSEATTLRLRTQLELGHNLAAAQSAASVDIPSASEDTILLVALAYAQAGQSSSIQSLNASLSSPGALQRLARIETGQLPLAEELYVSGLPRSSSTLLKNLPTSFERNIVLAHIAIDSHTATELLPATDYLIEAVALNPASITGHQLLSRVYTDRGLTTEAAAQAALASKLQNGRP